MVTSTNVPEVLTTSDCQERFPELLEIRGCDTVISPALDSEAASIAFLLNEEESSLIRDGNDRTSHDADTILNQEFFEGFASRFQVPTSSLDQGAQGTGSPPFSSVPVENTTTAVEHRTPRSTSLVNHSEGVREGGANAQLPNNPIGQSHQSHFPSYTAIFDYELEKLNREQGTLRKHFEETTSELKAELARKMAEVRSEYEMKSQEVDAAYITQASKEEAYRSSVAMNSLLASAYKSLLPVKNAATNTAAVRARNSQHSTQQQQVVQTNTHMNSTAPRPSVTTAEGPIPSGPLLHFPRFNTPQSRSISPQTAVQSNRTALPRPSITAEANIFHSPRCNPPQPRPISQRPVVQSNTHIRSTALPRPLVTSEATSLHSPPSNMHQPRPPPLISNHNPSSYSAASTPPVQGIVRRTMAPRPPPLISSHTPSTYSAASATPVHSTVRRAMPPHLRSSRAPNPAATPTTNQTRLVQEQHQQQENSNSSFVHLPDDE